MYNNQRKSSRSFDFRKNNSKKRTPKFFNPSEFLRSLPEPTISFAEPTITHSFNDFAIEEILKKNITFKNYTTPTPIQDQTIPHILKGADVIGLANTGTGKTAAFLIPLINKILQRRSEKVLIVAPTRELAVQIQQEVITIAKNLHIYSVVAIGGVNIKRQLNDLKREYNFLIGTPGRIKDLIRNYRLNLSSFQSVVLDEADTMVAIGFIHDIKFIISQLSKNRQSLFFSATIGPKEKELLQNFVTNPITISVKQQATAENVKQDVIKVPSHIKKIDHLHDLLIQKDYEKVLIFGRTKWGIQHLTDELTKRGFKADAIHGNKNQSQRLRALDKFRRNDIQILLATDVAARGLDIPNVSHVINYDLPESLESYIHRIGRTGRADKKGIALTYV